MLEQAQPEQPAGDSGSLPLEDRIANAFGDASPEQEQQAAPEQEQPEGEQPTTQEETFEFEMEGEKFVLPKKLEKGFLQERDYTQKSQTLADQRRLVELKEQQFQARELQTKFHNDVANEIKQMQMIDAVLEQPVNWQGMSTDEAFRHKIQLDDLRSQRDKLSRAVNDKYQQFQTQQQTSQQELQRKTLDAVRSRIPNWSDAVAKEVTDHFRDKGLTEADFSLFNQNPAYIEAAWKAMQFDRLQAKAKPTVEQAKAVKTTSAKPMPQSVKEHFAYKKALAKTSEGSPERRKVVENKIASIFSR